MDKNRDEWQGVFWEKQQLTGYNISLNQPEKGNWKKEDKSYH